MHTTEPNAEATGDPAAPGTWIGRVIDDRYRIVEVLGEGGMGAVFVAEHLKLRKLVALKTIRAEFSGHAELEARFSREALATGQIDHPHVVSAIDYGHLPEGGSYLVIQLVRGVSLGKQLESGPLPWPQAVELGAQIADALAAAHAAGIIHRDLKPDNVLLETREGKQWAKVVDFGIARLSDDSGAAATGSEPLTRMGAVIGTPGYMAPEQAVGGQIDARVDLYALGVILWECCSGRPLWEDEDITELFTRQLTTVAPPLQGVPPALAALVAQLLASAPGGRPATPALVRDELRAIARGEDAVAELGVSGRTSVVSRKTVATPRTLVASERPPASSAEQALRRRAVWIGGGVAVLLVLVVLGRSCGGESPKGPAVAGVAEPAAEKGAPAIVAAVAPGEAALPPGYAAHAETLLTVSNRKQRRAAAEAIASASDEEKQSIPSYLRNLAWLEKNQSCEAKKLVLDKIEAEGDLRAIPGLRITAASPRDGCGRGLFSRDCLECMREDLTRVLGRFEALAEKGQ
jgi:serine/threonine-protein kinase